MLVGMFANKQGFLVDLFTYIKFAETTDCTLFL